jgi:dethiobiotin synthetase
MACGLFVAGTGTDVGKTYVAALIVRQLVAEGHRVGVYKPVASGCRRCGTEMISDDALALWHAAGSPGELERVCPQRFAAPLAPPLAARAEAEQVDEPRLLSGLDDWQRRSEIVVVEGVGGLMSPVSDTLCSADLAVACGYPLVIVAANILGTINGTLQTLRTARGYGAGLTVAAVVVNDVGGTQGDPSAESNRMEIERRCRLSTLTAVAWKGQSFDRRIDWFGLASGNSGHHVKRRGGSQDGPHS